MIVETALPQPLRRTEKLAVQYVGEEVLVYDERTHQAFCLNAASAEVWKHCDGTRTASELGALLYPQVDAQAREVVVHLALAQLAKDSLLTGYLPRVAPAAVSRRTMLTRSGAGLAMLLPAIAVIAAPRAAQAYSGCFDCSNSISARRKQTLTDRRRIDQEAEASRSLGRFTREQ